MNKNKVCNYFNTSLAPTQNAISTLLNDNKENNKQRLINSEKFMKVFNEVNQGKSLGYTLSENVNSDEKAKDVFKDTMKSLNDMVENNEFLYAPVEKKPEQTSKNKVATIDDCNNISKFKRTLLIFKDDSQVMVNISVVRNEEINYAFRNLRDPYVKETYDLSEQSIKELQEKAKLHQKNLLATKKMLAISDKSSDSSKDISK